MDWFSSELFNLYLKLILKNKNKWEKKLKRPRVLIKKIKNYQKEIKNTKNLIKPYHYTWEFMKNLKNMGTQTKVANTPTLCACELSLLNSTYWIWTRQLAQRSNVAFGFSLLGVELVHSKREHVWKILKVISNTYQRKRKNNNYPIYTKKYPRSPLT